eukprot:m.121532 g.121532  ORF g.121532 m.121532 type:complete len:467 (+) comp9608_c0_seq1:2033-3433(+)
MDGPSTDSNISASCFTGWMRSLRCAIAQSISWRSTRARLPSFWNNFYIAEQACSCGATLIHTMISDGASNFKAAGARFAGEGSWGHCGAHNLQLAVRDVISQPPFAEAIADVRDVIRAVINTQDLKTRVSHKLRRSLCLDGATRWNSTLTMIEHFLRALPTLHNAFQEVEHEFAIVDETSQEGLAKRNALKFLAKCLDPFRRLTRQLQSTTMPTNAMLFVGIIDLLQQLETGPDVTKRIRESLTNAVSARFEDTLYKPSYAAMAACLHPLYFGRIFAFYQSKGMSMDALWARIADEATILEPNNAAVHVMIKAALQYARTKLEQLHAQEALKSTPLKELWSEPFMATVAGAVRMIIGVPAASSGVESLFSRAKHIRSPHRSSLSDDSLRYLLITKSFFQIDWRKQKRSTNKATVHEQYKKFSAFVQSFKREDMDCDFLVASAQFEAVGHDLFQLSGEESSSADDES